ncbi:MAG: ABC transporter permease subunit [Pirellulales bacterium]|nr:ABC transporter permease subunit [Pirellulales bacterium]
MPLKPTPPTGQTRARNTRPCVKLADSLARSIITVGGISTIAAVLGVCVYLVWVAAPLVRSARIDNTQSAQATWQTGAPQRLDVDEHRVLGIAFGALGELGVFRLDDGHLVQQISLALDDVAATAWSLKTPGSDAFAVGYVNGTVRVGTLAFETTTLSQNEAAKLEPAVVSDESPARVSLPDGVLVRSPQRIFRRHRVRLELGSPLATGTTSAIRRLDCYPAQGGITLATVADDGRAGVHWLKSATPGGDAKPELLTADLPLGTDVAGRPEHIVLFASSVLVASSDGQAVRFDIRRAGRPKLAEQVRLIDDPAARLTQVIPLAGRGTLVVGDSLGRARGWFLVRPDGLDNVDQFALRATHELSHGGAAVTALAASDRTRIVAVGRADGYVELYHATTDKLLVTIPPGEAAAVRAVAIAPKEDALLAATDGSLATSTLDLGYPEATLASLFFPVWYQDYNGPEHVWQSSGGSEANEPKLGLMPLVFGTLKATFYSLLFGVPVALLAAVYSSEFLSRQTRNRIKPTIELMASLPSVVLGYLAAFVLAPVAARWLPEILTSFFALPFTCLLGAYFWQLLPQRVSVRWQHLRFWLVVATLPLGLGLAWAAAPALERWLFAGDLMRWLDGGTGGAAGGWMLLTIPLAALAVALVMRRNVRPWLRRLTADWDYSACAMLELVRFLLGAAAVVTLAWLAAGALEMAGLDARGLYVGSFVQRNAMVVGFVMGFAIVPLIYTLAEDALSSVPDHLRSASLGAGATPWQTTTRIVIPSAMSGLFSAVMVGLGRAVGETMIVLMAAGNTPLMSWNAFEGFRTLSANLAEELPEAHQGSTHFRVLFLTALVLFALTFLINTLAEAVRQRFRRRTLQL